MIVALDRSLIFSQENLSALFDQWMMESGAVMIGDHIRRMICLNDGPESEEKLSRVQEMIRACKILRRPHAESVIQTIHWLYICRDIFGINTFEIDEELPSEEEEEE